jgi:hypothetical protein
MIIKTATCLVLSFASLAACSPSRTERATTSQAVRDDDSVPTDRWGAIAYGVEWLNRDTGVGNNYTGRAVSEATEEAAKDAAIGACGFQTCEIKVYVNVGCLSIAHGFDQDNREWYGFGAAKFDGTEGATVSLQKQNTRTLAGETAIEGCGGGTLNRFCTEQETFCTWDNNGEGSSADELQRWIDGQGGAEDPGVAATLDYIGVVTEGVLRNDGLTFQQARCVAGTRWARLLQAAEDCRLNADNLDRLYAAANAG